MATNPAPGACLKCGTPHVPGAAFCGSCGTPAGSPGQPQQGPYAPPPMPPRFGMGPQQGPTGPVMLAMDAASAIHAASAAVTATNGKVTWQGATSIAFTTKIGWGNGTFNGTIDAAPMSPAQTAVTLTLNPQYGVVIMSAMCGVFGMMFSMMNPYNAIPGIAFLFIGGLSALYAAYNLNGPGKDKKRQEILQALQASAPLSAAAAHPAQPGAMPPAPPPTPPTGMAAATPFEQLRKLADLRDSGAITATDFESAKARILGGLGQ